MGVESTARASANPLRRRMHILERASERTHGVGAGPNGKRESDEAGGQTLPSPTTSFDYPDDDEMDTSEDSAPQQEYPQQPFSFELDAGNEQQEEAHEPQHVPRPWYQPSYPVLATLVPPVGNWLTGGDHIKDFVVLLLVVFYLHQLIEVPWSLYHAARPRRPRYTRDGPPTLTSMRAKSQLRLIELFLLAFCVISPILGALLLRSLASLFSSACPASTTATNPQNVNCTPPISWFSTSLFALLTSLRPMRELVSRLSSHTSTLHTLSHAHSVPPPSKPDPHIDQLLARISKLEGSLKALKSAKKEHEDDADETLRRVTKLERKVGKLRNADKGKSAAPNNTVFIAAPGPPQRTWFGYTPQQASTSHIGITPHRSRSLHTILEEEPTAAAAAHPHLGWDSPPAGARSPILQWCIEIAKQILLLPVRIAQLPLALAGWAIGAVVARLLGLNPT